MKMTDALRQLAELTSHQWGMVTSSQARRLGITRLDMSRLAENGHLVRLSRGVYKDAGMPSGELDGLHAAWLSTDPGRLADERLEDDEEAIIVAGASAAVLHQIGDLIAAQHHFVTPARRQSQRPEIRYRRRSLDRRDITLVDGLPTMTIERTLADLVEDVGELSLVADALRDASGRSLDEPRLQELLAPLARRNGLRSGDGAALLDRLKEVAGIDDNAISRTIAATRPLGALVVANFMKQPIPPRVAHLPLEPLMERTTEVFREVFGESFRAALTGHLGPPEPSIGAALTSFVRSAKFDVLVRESFEHSIESSVLRGLSETWAGAVLHNLTTTDESRPLPRTAHARGSHA